MCSTGVCTPPSPRGSLSGDDNSPDDVDTTADQGLGTLGNVFR